MPSDISLFKSRLDKIENLAKGSPFARFLFAPIRYVLGVAHNRLFYPLFKKQWKVTQTTFFDSNMKLILPSGLDIFLLQSRTHDSEIRLTRYLLNIHQDIKLFWDIGAHYGFVSQWVATLVGEKGKVISVEAASTAFDILIENTQDFTNITPINVAISNEEGMMTFYEFPVRFSEYNTLLPTQFTTDDWYQRADVKKKPIRSTTLDVLATQTGIPDVIKMDVEGAEWLALQGAKNLFTTHAPIFIMEYNLDSAKNKAHKEATHWLTSIGYHIFFIDKNGDLVSTDAAQLIALEGTTASDNVVFVKK